MVIFSGSTETATEKRFSFYLPKSDLHHSSLNSLEQFLRIRYKFWQSGDI